MFWTVLSARTIQARHWCVDSSKSRMGTARLVRIHEPHLTLRLWRWRLSMTTSGTTPCRTSAVTMRRRCSASPIYWTICKFRYSSRSAQVKVTTIARFVRIGKPSPTWWMFFLNYVSVPYCQMAHLMVSANNLSHYNCNTTLDAAHVVLCIALRPPPWEISL